MVRVFQGVLGSVWVATLFEAVGSYFRCSGMRSLPSLAAGTCSRRFALLRAETEEGAEAWSRMTAGATSRRGEFVVASGLGSGGGGGGDDDAAAEADDAPRVSNAITDDGEVERARAARGGSSDASSSPGEDDLMPRASGRAPSSEPRGATTAGGAPDAPTRATSRQGLAGGAADVIGANPRARDAGLCARRDRCPPSTRAEHPDDRCIARGKSGELSVVGKKNKPSFVESFAEAFSDESSRRFGRAFSEDVARDLTRPPVRRSSLQKSIFASARDGGVDVLPLLQIPVRCIRLRRLRIYRVPSSSRVHHAREPEQDERAPPRGRRGDAACVHSARA